MPSLYENINELLKYDKGMIIPNPETLISIDIKSEKLRSFLILKNLEIVISRRSLTHILQKEKVGLILANYIEECLYDFNYVFLSNKSKKLDIKRYILLKQNFLEDKGVGIVIEHTKNQSRISIVTAMITKYSYLIRKYKKLR